MIAGGTPRLSAGLIAISIALVALTIGVGSANAAATRAEYVAQADPICQAGLNQVGKRLPGLIKRIARRPNITPPVAFAYGLALGGKIFAQETNKLAAIAPPPGDEATVGGWLDGHRTYKRKLDTAVAAGKHKKKKQMLRRFKQAAVAVAQANQLVADFGFQYCVVSASASSTARSATSGTSTPPPAEISDALTVTALGR